MEEQIVSGVVVEGHRVASGEANEPRFPNGTLALQIPCFARLGLDLANYRRGTLNVSIAPFTFRLGRPWKTLPGIRWSPVMPAENFSFYRCGIRLAGGETFASGLVYWPHPSTKPEYFQDPYVLEILAPDLPGARYGAQVELNLKENEIAVEG